MEITESSCDGIALLHVRGDMDMANAPLLATALAPHLKEPEPPVVLDLSGCPFIDSGGLNVLLDAALQLEAVGGWMGALGVRPNLMRVFQIVGLTTCPWFRILEDLSEVCPEEAAARGD